MGERPLPSHGSSAAYRRPLPPRGGPQPLRGRPRMLPELDADRSVPPADPHMRLDEPVDEDARHAEMRLPLVKLPKPAAGIDHRAAPAALASELAERRRVGM